MTHRTRIARRIALGLVALTFTLGGVLHQPAQALAGVGGSPGSSGVSLTCSRGEHTKDVKLV